MNQTVQKTYSSDAVRFFNESITWEKQGDNMQAWHLLTAAIMEDSTLPGAWHNLGVVLGKLKHFPAAACAFYKAMELAPTANVCLGNYAWTLHLAGRSEQALPLIKRALEQDSSKPEGWVNLSQIELALDHYEEALKAGKKAIELADNPNTRIAFALALLRNGNYTDGLKEYEARFPYVLPHLLKYPYPMWRGEDISNQRLFLPAEQGIGDAVQFLRFIPAVAERAKQVICYVHDNTVKLYRRNLPKNVELHPLPRELPAADVFCPLMSLPIGLQLSNEQIKNSWWKYKYSASHVHAKDFPKNVVKIGICWAGDPKHDNDIFRSMNLKDFMPLAELPNAQLYSFQIGARSIDMDNFAAHGIVRNLAPRLRDVNDTCEILSQHIDIVVTIDSAFAHMAGSMGVKTFMLIGKNGVDWRWLTGSGKSHWYPTLEMVRQEKHGDWESVINRVKQKITGLEAPHKNPKSEEGFCAKD